MTLRGQDQGQKQRESQAEVEVVWGEGQPQLSALRGCWKTQREPSLAPRMPCHHGEALECTNTQWAPGAQRALRFDNHIKVLATSVGVQEKGLLAGFNPPKLGSLTLSRVREGGQQPSICQQPCTGLQGLIFYQKQREKRSSPGHHGECYFTLYTHISREVQSVLLYGTHKITLQYLQR